MVEYRCKYCNKLLLKGNYKGTIEVLCNRCKKINNIRVSEKENT
jgi:phage FluMu protein Com